VVAAKNAPNTGQHAKGTLLDQSEDRREQLGSPGGAGGAGGAEVTKDAPSQGVTGVKRKAPESAATRDLGSSAPSRRLSMCVRRGHTPLLFVWVGGWWVGVGVYVCVCVCVCVYVWVGVWVWVCVCLTCTGLFAGGLLAHLLHIHVCTHIRICTHACIHWYGERGGGGRGVGPYSGGK
jgi:hypothetical protein